MPRRRCRYELALEAGDPEPDDVIQIEAAINKTSAVSFRLANSFDSEAPYQAYFTSDSPSVFTVTPVTGVLPRAGTQGTLFTVSYTPIEYGKPMRGMLVIVSRPPPSLPPLTRLDSHTQRRPRRRPKRRPSPRAPLPLPHRAAPHLH